MKVNPTAIYDSREQCPWVLPGLPMVEGSLPTGDYSVAGGELQIAVERKSLSDLLGCLGSGRDRFRRELQRMGAYRFRTVIVECSPFDVAAGKWRSRLQPAHVWGAIASWSGLYGVPFMLAGTREMAAEFCERFLRCAATHIADEAAALTGADAVKPILEAEAKGRKKRKPTCSGKLTGQNKGDSRDKIAEAVGTSAATLAGSPIDAEFQAVEP